LVAGNESIAIASKASVFSKQGSPSPDGTFQIMQVAVPPIESLASLTYKILSTINTPVSITGHQVFTISTSI